MLLFNGKEADCRVGSSSNNHVYVSTKVRCPSDGCIVILVDFSRNELVERFVKVIKFKCTIHSNDKLQRTPVNNDS